MEAADLPRGLRHLAPMSRGEISMLGFAAFMGTGNHNLIHLSMFEHLKHYLKEDFVGTDHVALVNYLVDQDVLESAERYYGKPTAFVPKYDQAGFLNCLTFEQKSRLFLAAAMVLVWLSPGDPDVPMYLEWPEYKKYRGHTKSLAVHWDALHKCDETVTVPLCFVRILQEYAKYMGETNDRHNAILLADVGLKIVDCQSFEPKGSPITDHIHANLLTTKGSVSIQLLNYTTAREALEQSIELREREHSADDNIEILTAQTYLASLTAAQGEYEESMSLCWKLRLLLSSPHFNTYDDDEQRVLLMRVSILGGKVATLVGKYSEAGNMLDHAFNLYDNTMDNPVYHRAMLQASGHIEYSKGRIRAAKGFYRRCTDPVHFGTVMRVNQADEERTISIYHRLAVIDVKDENARAARSKVKAALKMCKESGSRNLLPWKGRLELTWAEILRKFEYFAGCWEREEEDKPEKHEAAAQQVASELGIVTDGLVTDEQFVSLLPWDIL